MMPVFRNIWYNYASSEAKFSSTQSNYIQPFCIQGECIIPNLWQSLIANIQSDGEKQLLDEMNTLSSCLCYFLLVSLQVMFVYAIKFERLTNVRIIHLMMNVDGIRMRIGKIYFTNETRKMKIFRYIIILQMFQLHLQTDVWVLSQDYKEHSNNQAYILLIVLYYAL